MIRVNYHNITTIIQMYGHVSSGLIFFMTNVFSDKHFIVTIVNVQL